MSPYRRDLLAGKESKWNDAIIEKLRLEMYKLGVIKYYNGKDHKRR